MATNGTPGTRAHSLASDLVWWFSRVPDVALARRIERDWCSVRVVLHGLSVFGCFALALIAIEIAFSPCAVYVSVLRVLQRGRAWFAGPPAGTPPHAGALAMPKPQPPQMIDAVSRVRVGR
jgi:hypothetical protein